MTTVLQPAGYALKGHQDASWPGCPNCQGYGKITQELRIAGAAGAQGEPCAVCNGVGRIPDPSWPRCGCGGREPDVAAGAPTPAPCPVCFGLGLVSPLAEENFANALMAARGEVDRATTHLAAIEAARPDAPKAARRGAKAPDAS
jgi:hypothetical protein